MSSERPLLLTAGMGIGPEVCLGALAREGFSDVVIVGRASAVRAANAVPRLPIEQVHELRTVAGKLTLYEPPAGVEPVEVAAIRAAAEACLAGRAAAMVTGPIHKKTLVDQGFRFKGHTDFLGELCEVPEPVMAFVGGELRVALVTHHLPLMQVGAALNTDEIARVARVVLAALRRDLGMEHPRLSICGLNPHAGEGGMLGSEEIEIIGPACDLLRAEGHAVAGPVSAETAFLDARSGRSDLVLAMYHDQGLAPLKAVDFGRSVNWTLGLPIIRTSVDHGTADHLVGTGLAEDHSMVSAIRLARRIIRRRTGSSPPQR